MNATPRLFLVLLSFTLTSSLSAANLSSEASAKEEPHPGQAARLPNIVVFLADDLGYADIGANGYATDIATPRIDALAGGGVRFTDGYATSAGSTISTASSAARAPSIPIPAA